MKNSPLLARRKFIQLSTCNCCEGGADPVAVLGEDKINWPGVFEFCEHRGGAE